MRSMTGYGACELPFESGRLSIEIRGVNHRFLDVRVRTPHELNDVAPQLEQLAREKLSRGRYDIALRLDASAFGAPILDRAKARAAYLALCELRDELSPSSEVPLLMLTSVPDLFVSPLSREQDKLFEVVRAAFAGATAALDTMREHEGALLADDLRLRLTNIRGLSSAVRTRAPEVLEHHRRRLAERALRLRASLDATIDDGRLEQEIALFAERVDICEELTRVDAHVTQFDGLMKKGDSIGRRLDFLLQELAREINTIGAKSPDAPISHFVVEMKAEIERMREQVQNVE